MNARTRHRQVGASPDTPWGRGRTDTDPWRGGTHTDLCRKEGGGTHGGGGSRSIKWGEGFVTDTPRGGGAHRHRSMERRTHTVGRLAQTQHGGAHRLMEEGEDTHRAMEEGEDTHRAMEEGEDRHKKTRGGGGHTQTYGGGGGAAEIHHVGDYY